MGGNDVRPLSANARHDAWAESGFSQRHKTCIGSEHGKEWLATRGDVLAKVRDNGIAVLLGPRGVGKTQMACSVAHAICLGDGWSTRYFRFGDYAARLRSDVYHGHVMSETKWLNLYAVVGLLVLDELHECVGSPADDVLLRGTVDRRYMKRRPTLLVSNHTPETFPAAVGDSVMSRIAECGQVFVCRWKSYRTTK